MTTEESYFSYRQVKVPHVPGGGVEVACPQQWTKETAECGEIDAETAFEKNITGRRLWNLTVPFADFMAQWHLLDGKRVYVLGAGLGVEAFSIAKAFPNSHVTVTDGDSTLLPGLTTAVSRNHLDNVKVLELRWGNQQDLNNAVASEGYADVIVGVEILYREDQIEPLINSVRKLIGTGGGLFALGHVVHEPALLDHFRQRASEVGWKELNAETNPLEEVLGREGEKLPTSLLAIWQVPNGQHVDTHQGQTLRLSQDAAHSSYQSKDPSRT